MSWFYFHPKNSDKSFNDHSFLSGVNTNDLKRLFWTRKQLIETHMYWEMRIISFFSFFDQNIHELVIENEFNSDLILPRNEWIIFTIRFFSDQYINLSISILLRLSFHVTIYIQLSTYVTHTHPFILIHRSCQCGRNMHEKYNPI